MRENFSISFLLVGLPIVFAIETIFHLNQLFIYSFIGIILVLGLNLKNLFLFKITNKNFILLLITFFLIILFFIAAILTNPNLKDLKNLFITLFLIIIVIFFNKKNKYSIDLLKFIFYISLLSVIMIYISTPVSISYWSLHGGRLYIGNTNNPNLIAWVVSLNLISSLFFMFKFKTNFYFKLFLILCIIADFYLFFLSQSKSSIIGFILIGIYYLIKYKNKIIFNKKFLLFFISMLCVILVYWDNFIYYLNLIYGAFNSLIFNTDLVMSADIRHENFIKAFQYMSLSNIFGYGIHTFRMDSPILQVFIDFGNIIGIIVFFLLVIIPLYKIYKSFYMNLTINQEFSIVIYIFFLPNLFFHGTPYEWNSWLPTLLVYMYL